MAVSDKLILAGCILLVAGPLLVMLVRRLMRREPFENRGTVLPPSGFDAGPLPGPGPVDGGSGG